MSKRIWVDPDSGWRYGFPKIYDPDVDGELRDWLQREGYEGKPAYYRTWNVSEETDGQ